MTNPATVREQRLRKTKAQLIDEIDALERRAAATPKGGTELKRREQELAEKEAQLRVALDNMPGGMMLGDGDLNYVLFNSQYSELHDYPDGLLKVGGSILDETRYQADRGCQRRLETGPLGRLKTDPPLDEQAATRGALR